jgi:hypothetical protein
LLALTLLQAGCGYVQDRSRDLLDVFQLEMGYGLGLEADVRTTDLLQTGFGMAWSKRGGLRDGGLGTSEELAAGLPVSPFIWSAAKSNGTALPAPPGYLGVRLGLETWLEGRPTGRSQAEGSLLSPVFQGESRTGWIYVNLDDS